MRTRHATPISRGFRACNGVAQMDLIELVALQHIMEWAAQGCLHENSSALGAELKADAVWLGQQISARAQQAMLRRGAA
jgi:hypothetical protein